MDDQQPHIDTDRASAMIVLYAQGLSFADMVKPMIACRMLVCQEGHRQRPQGDATVCATCENTLLVSWRRHMKLVGATGEDLAAVKGEWFTTHEVVERICARHAVTEEVSETTITEEVDGKPVTVTTIRRQYVVNANLLRLWVDVRDKISRMKGLNVKNPASSQKIQRRLMRVYERDADGSGAEPAN